MKKVLFPGSFDPLTLGHLDLIERSSKLFNEVVVLLATNTNKNYMFTESERRTLVEEAVAHLDNVSVESLTDGLLADYYRKVNADAVVRGIRNSTDFEYEYNVAGVNRKQYEGYETIVLFAADQYRHLSSSLIKEIAYFEGSIHEMVPPNVEKAMLERSREIKEA